MCIAPKIEMVNCTSDSYTSMQLTVTLQYTGGRPVTEFRIKYRIATTIDWTPLSLKENYSNTAEAWSYKLTVGYDQRGYEVEIIAANSIGDSNIVTTSPTKLRTGTYNTRLFN